MEDLTGTENDETVLVYDGKVDSSRVGILAMIVGIFMSHFFHVIADIIEHDTFTEHFATLVLYLFVAAFSAVFIPEKRAIRAWKVAKKHLREVV